MSCDEPTVGYTEIRIENGSNGASRGYVYGDRPRKVRNEKRVLSGLNGALRG